MTARDLPLIVNAWLHVMRVHWLLRQGGFEPLRRYLRALAPRTNGGNGANGAHNPSDAEIQRICAAVEEACSLYFTRSTCLHRSAALVRLVRSAGGDASLVFGVQVEPYRGHAWVEYQGVVLNDEPTVHAQYTVVERM